MPICLTNAVLCDIDPPRVEPGALRASGGRIIARGREVLAQPDDDTVDCRGAVVLPGFVNGHTHLYSALAVGMPPPEHPPRNFREILEQVWWRLDQALDTESIEMSARVGAMDAIRCGTTTLIDHHASPSCITGSLDRIETGLHASGVRGVLCYETTDRHGQGGALAGLAENRRYIEKCRASGDGRYAGLVGAHASFTLDDATLMALAELCQETRAGLHIHAAEDPCDEADSRSRGAGALIDRLTRFNLLDTQSIIAHGTHFDAESIGRINAIGPTLAHNPRSNMNNAVGYTPVADYRCPVMLGTDGIGGNLFAESKTAWFMSRHAGAGLSPDRIVGFLAASARRASASLGVTVGRLDAGAAADIVVTDYVPSTPLTRENLAGHLVFGLESGHVRHVMSDGIWRMRDRNMTGCDALALRRSAESVSQALWRRMASL